MRRRVAGAGKSGRLAPEEPHDVELSLQAGRGDRDHRGIAEGGTTLDEVEKRLGAVPRAWYIGGVYQTSARSEPRPGALLPASFL